MKPSRSLTILCLAVAVASAWIGPVPRASGQALPPAVVAVVDTQQLMNQSVVGQDIRTQVNAIRKDIQAEIESRQKALRTEEEALRRQRTILSPEAFASKQREFQGKVAAVQRYVQDKSRVVEKAITTATNEVRQAVIGILNDLSVELGFNVVIDRTQVVFGFKSLDVTEKVLERLNKRLTKVVVQMPTQ